MRMSRPVRITGVGQLPVRTSWYAKVRPIPRIRAAYTTVNIAGMEVSAGSSVSAMRSPEVDGDRKAEVAPLTGQAQPRAL